MEIVINQDKTEGHIIDKYKFKVLSSKESEDISPKRSETFENKENTADEQEFTEENMTITASSKDELVESLLKKIDEMTSNFIKLQMKLESKEEEFKQQLEMTKKEAFDEGVVSGKGELEAQLKGEHDEDKKRVISSITKLEESAKEYKTSLEEIKKELLDAALDISKEVIAVELGENSARVAKKLSDGLITELQNASKITLKVNPLDYSVLSEELGTLETVQLVSDSAISKGGVVVTSDVGNRDAQILNRYERVKKTVLQDDAGEKI